MRRQGEKSARDPERQRRERLAKGRLRAVGRLRPAENEPEIARALGQRNETLSGMRRNDDVLDVRHRARLFQTGNLLQPPGARDRNHHDARRARVARASSFFSSQGMAEDQLLERNSRSEGERPGAEAAGGSGIDADDSQTDWVYAARGVLRA